MKKFDLCQWQVGEKIVHESDFDESQIEQVLDGYESLFINMGFNPVVSVNRRTDLPLLKIEDNGKLKTTLFLERK